MNFSFHLAISLSEMCSRLWPEGCLFGFCSMKVKMLEVDEAFDESKINSNAFHLCQWRVAFDNLRNEVAVEEICKFSSTNLVCSFQEKINNLRYL